MMIRAVIWDLDGTLIDSEDYHWRSWHDTLAAEGIALTHDQFLASFGQRNDRILRRWLGEDADPERIGRIGDAKEELYRRFARDEGLELLPGAMEWLQRLGDDGWRQAIASSAPRLNVDTVLRALQCEPFFASVVAAEDVRRGKPDPEIFLAAARAVAVPPARCIVVEDAEAGVQAAHAAGMRCIGVSRGAHLPADVVVASLAELPRDTFSALIAG
jgi:beta-phosphoglucomutase